MDELEERIGDRVQATFDRRAFVHLQMKQCGAKDDGDDQNLKQFAPGKSADEILRENVENEIERRVRRACGLGRFDACGCRRRCHAGSETEQIACDKAKGECQRRDDLKIDHRHQADFADALEISGRDNAYLDAKEDQRSNRGLDQPQENIAQYLELACK